MEKIDLKQIERNIFRDYFRDGLVDMTLGAYFLLIGLGLLAGTVAPFVVLPILFFAPLLRSLKKRFTYPRTGYVELRQGDPQALPWFALASFVLGLVALIAVLIASDIIAQPGRWYRWMPIFFGIWLAGVFLGLGLRVRLVRYCVVASLALAGGPVSALIPLSGKLDHIGVWFALLGAVSLAWGTCTFVRFLRKYPVSTEGSGDATD